MKWRPLNLDTLNLAGLQEKVVGPSIRTRTESRSTTGGEIGAALAISIQEKPPAADAAANAADAFRNSRRFR
jgi:hypothetical protein